MGESNQDSQNKMSRREFLGIFDPKKYHESEPNGRPFSVSVVGPEVFIPNDHIWFTDLKTLPMYDLTGQKPSPPELQNIAYRPQSQKANGLSYPMWVETVFPADVGQTVNERDFWKIAAEWFGVPLVEMAAGTTILKANSTNHMTRR